MGRRRTIALIFGIAAASLLLFLAKTDRLPFRMLLQSPVAFSVCTSSYFGNQCSDSDLGAIMRASSDRAFSGRGMEALVSFAGVRRDSDPGRMAIVGRRSDADVVCLTRDADLIRAVQFELTPGMRARLSGNIDRREGRVLFLVQCAFWRDG